MSEDHREDQEMVRLALDGDPKAMRALVRKLTPVIQVRVARYLLTHAEPGRSQRSDCGDLVQEVFLRLLARNARVLRAWHPEKGLGLVSFVGMVAQREVLNVLQSGRRRPWSTEAQSVDETASSSDRSPEERAVLSDRLHSLLRRLYRWLTPRGRELFQCVYVEEQSLEEVAHRYGMKRSALYAWRNRVASQARTIIQELDDDDFKIHQPRTSRFGPRG